MTRARSALIMAGGTGGHVFPALAMARVLRDAASTVVWLGTRRGIEARLVPAERHSDRVAERERPARQGRRDAAAAPFRLAAARWCRRCARCAGTGPASCSAPAASSSGPGRHRGVAAAPAAASSTSRTRSPASPIACSRASPTRVLEGFPGQLRPRRAGRARRQSGAPRDRRRCAPPEQRYAGREGAARLLVFGGSQGAARLNAVRAGRARASCRRALRPEVLHQTGERGVDETAQALRARGIEADVRAVHRRHGRAPTAGPISWSAAPAR